MRGEKGGAAPYLSIIIPVLNEETLLGETLRSIDRNPETEVLVADGGSTDATRRIAESAGARVLPAKPGRAVQMNAGAAASRGEVLLFLHADTRLPCGYSGQIQAVLNRPGAVAGAFRLGFDDSRASLRLVAAGANLRSRWRQLPYGDQALFVRKDFFVEIGGFRDLPVMEDYDLVLRLRRKGRVSLTPGYVTTSPRRWLKHGIVRTTLIHQFMIAGWHLGISPSRLAEWHGRKAKAVSDPQVTSSLDDP